jgi:hypothetical protein
VSTEKAVVAYVTIKIPVDLTYTGELPDEREMRDDAIREMLHRPVVNLRHYVDTVTFEVME